MTKHKKAIYFKRIDKCEKCGYRFGDDWLDDGATCPKCKLVN